MRFFFSSRRRHTRWPRDWSSDVCSSDLQLFSISNSSGSQSGERPSELAADPSGITIALYNPAISYGETTGSRAVLVYGENDTDQFFSSENQEITDRKSTRRNSSHVAISYAVFCWQKKTRP